MTGHRSPLMRHLEANLLSPSSKRQKFPSPIHLKPDQCENTPPNLKLTPNRKSDYWKRRAKATKHKLKYTEKKVSSLEETLRTQELQVRHRFIFYYYI